MPWSSFFKPAELSKFRREIESIKFHAVKFKSTIPSAPTLTIRFTLPFPISGSGASRRGRERNAEMMREFAGYCCELGDVFDIVGVR